MIPDLLRRRFLADALLDDAGDRRAYPVWADTATLCSAGFRTLDVGLSG